MIKQLDKTRLKKLLHQLLESKNPISVAHYRLPRDREQTQIFRGLVWAEQNNIGYYLRDPVCLGHATHEAINEWLRRRRTYTGWQRPSPDWFFTTLLAHYWK